MRSAAPVLAALATAALATGVTACSLRQEPSDPPVSTSSASAPPVASPLPTPVVLGETNDSDPDSVADAVAVALSVHDARTDASSQAVWTRARPLLTGDLAALVKARDLSVDTMRNIRQNLVFAFVYNVVGIPLAAGALYPAFGWLLSPVIAAAAMALSSVSVITNSLRLRRHR